MIRTRVVGRNNLYKQIFTYGPVLGSYKYITKCRVVQIHFVIQRMDSSDLSIDSKL